MAIRAQVTGVLVQIYEDFGGDVDMYQRRGSPQGEVMNAAWGTIEDLRGRLFLGAVGRASAEFSASAEADLLAWTLDEEARRLIRKMVARDVMAQTHAV